MKRMTLIVSICAAVVLMGTALVRLTVAQTPKKERAVVDLSDKTKMIKEILQGKYIFVHDEEATAKGQPCFYVYKYSQDAAGKPEIKPENLVLSFNCQHLERNTAPQMVITYTMVPGNSDLFEIKEVQFAGSPAVHRLPNS
ncbi:MAG: hypothetical protein ACJ74J_23825 [Blastocatellia bacterium]